MSHSTATDDTGTIRRVYGPRHCSVAERLPFFFFVTSQFVNHSVLHLNEQK